MFGHKTKYFPTYLSSFLPQQLSDEEKAKKLSGSKIVFNNFHYAEIESVNNKFFEINVLEHFKFVITNLYFTT